MIIIINTRTSSNSESSRFVTPAGDTTPRSFFDNTNLGKGRFRTAAEFGKVFETGTLRGTKVPKTVLLPELKFSKLKFSKASLTNFSD